MELKKCRDVVKDKLAEIETDPKFGRQTWFDEDVANLLYDILESSKE